MRKQNQNEIIDFTKDTNEISSSTSTPICTSERTSLSSINTVSNKKHRIEIIDVEDHHQIQKQNNEIRNINKPILMNESNINNKQKNTHHLLKSESLQCNNKLSTAMKFRSRTISTINFDQQQNNSLSSSLPMTTSISNCISNNIRNHLEPMKSELSIQSTSTTNNQPIQTNILQQISNSNHSIR
jgi:hypothetical protein